jgi:hypothetical protein
VGQPLFPGVCCALTLNGTRAVRARAISSDLFKLSPPSGTRTASTAWSILDENYLGVIREVTGNWNGEISAHVIATSTFVSVSRL